MRVATTLVLVAGCYSPTIETGAPCSPRGTCPGDLFCDPVLNVCVAEPSALLDAAVAIDAAPDAMPDAMPDARLVTPAVRDHVIVDGSGTSTMFDVPAGTQPGDLLLAHVNCDLTTAANITTPAGWTKVIERDGVEDPHYAGIFYRFAEAGTTSYTWTFPTEYNSIALIAITDAAAMPIDVVDAVALPAAMPPVAPSITTTRPGTLTFAIFTQDLANAPFTAIPGMTMLYERTGDLHLYGAHADAPTAGPTGTRATTTTDDGPTIAISLAIAPK